MKHYLRAMKKNIPLNYAFLSLCHLDFTRGLWMIYLKLEGFSLIQLGILEGAFHLTSFLMEVPTGLVADILGRKLSRILGRAFYILSILILFLTHNMAIQLIGFIFCALNYNLESGAGEALVYDSLKELKKETTFKSIAGYNNLIYSLGSIISFLLGGFIAFNFGYSWIFYGTILSATVSLITSLFFVEPKIGHKERKRLKELHWLKALGEQMKESFIVIKRTPYIAYIILFTELIFMFIVSLFFYLQVYWKGLGWSEFSIGIVLAFSAFTCAIGGFSVKVLEKWIGLKGMLIFIPLLLIVCLWGVAISRWQEVFFALTGFIEGVLYVVVSDYLNKSIPSERRATILSFQSMAFSFYMIIFFPLLGVIGEKAGFSIALWTLAISGTILYFFYLIIVLLIEKKRSL